MRITIVGTGYVGLVTGTCFSESGNDVICVDRDAAKISSLEAGHIPIYEPGLEELVTRNAKAGRLTFTTDLKNSISQAEVAFIAVGTPQAEDGSCDLSAVKAVATEIGKAMVGPLVVVNKSTVPVGTAAMVRDLIRESSSHSIEVVSNPEFLKEGAAIDDFMKPDRVVIGTDDAGAADLMRDLYSPFVRTGKPLLVMDPASAEMTKYASNAMLATKISFMNDIARLCETVGANVSKVRQGMGSDQRIGPHFLFPGVGYGGSCFPKDVRALSALAREQGSTLAILDAVDAVNDRQKLLLVEKVVKRFGEDLTGHVFGMWGLAFKPRTDDMREAPSVVIASELVRRGAVVRGHDPEAIETARAEMGDLIEYSSDPYEAIDGASALLLVTEWNEYRRPDFQRMTELLEQPVIYDGRNIWTEELTRKHGLEYHGIGSRSATDVRK
ncbi:MAG: UDP-glucose/GDP-mannose dehydrogenase family protein [Planctomycetota bacterium]|nr:UDP-glucose/GDP-mannose dehydrogenase family protein [Planctomycetota bacterium]